MKLNDAFGLFYNNLLVKGRSLNTIDAYKSQLCPFLKFTGDIEISEISYNLYCDYIIYLRNKKNLSSVTIHSYANSLKVFLNFLYRHHYIKKDIASEIELPKQFRKEPAILSPETISIILNDFDINDKIGCRNILILVLAFDCGLRLAEMVRLQIEDIMFDLKLIRVSGKGSKHRILPMSDALEFYLNRYLSFYENKKIGQLLVSRLDENISIFAISSLFKRIKKKYKLPKFNPHLLRHSYATLYLVNGGDSLSLQQLLGHTTLNMTSRYVHLSQSMKLLQQKQYSPLSNYMDNKKAP